MNTVTVEGTDERKREELRRTILRDDNPLRLAAEMSALDDDGDMPRRIYVGGDEPCSKAYTVWYDTRPGQCVRAAQRRLHACKHAFVAMVDMKDSDQEHLHCALAERGGSVAFFTSEREMQRYLVDRLALYGGGA